MQFPFFPARQKMHYCKYMWVLKGEMPKNMMLRTVFDRFLREVINEIH